MSLKLLYTIFLSIARILLLPLTGLAQKIYVTKYKSEAGWRKK